MSEGDVSREAFEAHGSPEMTNTEPVARSPHASPQLKEPSRKLVPSLREEDQEAAMNELPAVEVIGPPAFASPDPATNAGKLVPIEEHPLSDQIAEDYGLAVANPAEVVATSGLSSDSARGAVEDVTELPSDTSEWTKNDWQGAAKSRGLATRGNMKDIAQRVRKHDRDAEKTAAAEKEIRDMNRDDLDKLAGRHDIDSEQYSKAEDLAEAIIAATRGDDVPPGDKANDNDTNS